MSFEPLNELERLLMAAPSDPSVRPAFYRALLDEELFVATDRAYPTGALLEGSGVTVIRVEMQGRPHAAIFSAQDRIAAIAPEGGQPFLAMKGRDAFALLGEADIVLNPGSDFGKFFPPHETASMLDGSVFATAAQPAPPGGHRQLDVGGRRILLAQPAVYPQQLVDALAKFFDTVPSIRAAYLAHGSVAGSDGPHTIIGIETDGDWATLMQSIGVVLEVNTKPGELIDLVKVTNTRDDVIGSYMIKNSKPFYGSSPRKKWLGLF